MEVDLLLCGLTNEREGSSLYMRGAFLSQRKICIGEICLVKIKDLPNRPIPAVVRLDRSTDWNSEQSSSCCKVSPFLAFSLALNEACDLPKEVIFLSIEPLGVKRISIPLAERIIVSLDTFGAKESLPSFDFTSPSMKSCLHGQVVSPSSCVEVRFNENTHFFRVLEVELFTEQASPTKSMTKERLKDKLVAIIGSETNIGFSPDPSLSSSSGLNSSVLRSFIALQDSIRVEVAQRHGGLDSQVKRVLDGMVLSLARRVKDSLLRPSLGMLLHGPTGTGKSSVVNAICKASGLKYSMIDASSVFQAADVVEHLGALFSACRSAEPHILVFDNIEAICGTSIFGTEGSLIEGGVCAAFLSFLDSSYQMINAHGIYIIGVTSSLSSILPSVLRSGRLDETVHFPVPSPEARRLIASTILTSYSLPPPSREAILEFIENTCHGYVGADLRHLCREAVYEAIRAPEEGNDRTLGLSHFLAAKMAVRPSVLIGNDRCLALASTSASPFDLLRGMDSILDQVMHEVVQPWRFVLNPANAHLRAAPPRGVMVHSDPGNGKTSLAVAIARALGFNVVVIDGADMRSKVYGEAERTLAVLFQKASASAPCVILLDQVDQIGASRRGSDIDSRTDQSSFRMISALRAAISDINRTSHFTLVIATTSYLHDIHPSLYSPSCFDYTIALPSPSGDARIEIIRYYLAKHKVSLDLICSQEDLQELVESTEGWCCAQLSSFVKEAVFSCLRRQLPLNTKDDLCSASSDTIPLVYSDLKSSLHQDRNP